VLIPKKIDGGYALLRRLVEPKLQVSLTSRFVTECVFVDDLLNHAISLAFLR
jgi:hypothetical protein